MNPMSHYNNFVTSESEAERLSAISALCKLPGSWQKDLLLWKMLSLVPAKSEKSRIAASLNMPEHPNSSWAMASCLLADSDQDVIGNTINSLNFSRNRSLSHRLIKFFQLPERPQRILYCLARYAEETIDRRMTPYLAPFLTSELSDAFLARSFNALLRLGVIDKAATKVASELIASHIDATNMDRKAAVSAIVYLFFAGGQEDLDNLKSVHSQVSIPELRRLLNWGFADVASHSQSTSGKGAVKSFFAKAVQEDEPNFTGFGCFSRPEIAQGLEEFLDTTQAHAEKVTRMILALGQKDCVETLASHKKFSVKQAVLISSKRGDHSLTNLWKRYLPFDSHSFIACVQDVANYDAWHSSSAETLFCCLEEQSFSQNGPWQEKFMGSLQKQESLQTAIKLFCAQLFAYEKKPSYGLEQTLMTNLEALKHRLVRLDKKEWQTQFYDQIYGTIVGGKYPCEFTKTIFSQLNFGPSAWAFNGFALAGPDIDQPTLRAKVKDELQNLGAKLHSNHTDQESYLLEVTSRFMGILVGAERLGLEVSTENLELLQNLADTIQGILSTVENTKELPDPEMMEEEDAANWHGHVSVDLPIARWNTIIQTCLRTELSAEERPKFEFLMREGIRVAPHVEKRWVVRALVRLGTDDSIKAVLYQALQHVDGEFVALAIKELLASKHPRAQQALIRCVGRSTVPDELKLIILEEISLENPTDVLNELRTLEILRLSPHIDDAVRDAVGRVAALIDVEDRLAQSNTTQQNPMMGQDVDLIIKKLLKDSDLLTVDIRSALRTAEMILIQSRAWGSDAVDLSPIVNMHCKAVELTMRETFEAYTDAVIRKGALSRKLDVLGYARPIPEKMQIFEDYLAALPIVKSIPYFSKFKLRKMLRAICLFRPGKRFTLDGPKAFALLFLVASRKECQFGMENLIPLDFPSDIELFEFIKLVHSLQDSRNRAVHEGLTWEAKDEIESMKSQAYKIIEVCLRISKFLHKRAPTMLGNQLGMGA